MFKKHIIFQILYRSSMPRLSQILSELSALIGQLTQIDWPNTTSMSRECNAPFHNRELKLW